MTGSEGESGSGAGPEMVSGSDANHQWQSGVRSGNINSLAMGKLQQPRQYGHDADGSHNHGAKPQRKA